MKEILELIDLKDILRMKKERYWKFGALPYKGECIHQLYMLQENM